MLKNDDVDIAQPLPRIGDPAPYFEVETTHGVLSLENFKGQWLVLFSHPMDFTPVCTSEFIAFAKSADKFKEMGVELLGLSIDSVFSHIAWVRNVKEKFDVSIPFPIIADMDGHIANLYGMVMPGDLSTVTSRCLFVIDTNAVIRATIYYPFTTGRNIQEVIRLVAALQVCDENAVGTPADWQPGDPVIQYPPRTQDNAEQVASNGDECIDWYYCTRKL
ncbi:peroxiredoxin [Desulfosarcina ovata subsp. sediminis]|uniref:Peroxiredoxin n=2 Tax=Desulfosarcina ovata TaxID=83564 RepID=A0A5K7ZLY9_9BACT|nr:peroxiredoxin [Desulfosarcina ovata subsp. sediminis]